MSNEHDGEIVWGCEMAPTFKAWSGCGRMIKYRFFTKSQLAARDEAVAREAFEAGQNCEPLDLTIVDPFAMWWAQRKGKHE